MWVQHRYEEYTGVHTSKTSAILFKAPDLFSLSLCFGSCPTCTTPNLEMGVVYEKYASDSPEDVYISLSTFSARFSEH